MLARFKTMKLINHTLIAIVAAALVGCAEWHSTGPSPGQTSVPAWNQVQAGMTRQQVYALMGKPLRETEQLAAWRGPEVKKGWPSDHPSITYRREYEAYFDSEGRVRGMRDFERADHR
jgi:outer membrane protein assembly factor BamE (lipoprotein component of BamABCDE complex)